MRDSINNTENNKAAIQSQLKYECEKKALADSIKVAVERKVVQIKLKQEKTLRYALYAGLTFSRFISVWVLKHCLPKRY